MVACARRFSVALFLAAAGLTATGCAGSEDELPREPVSGTVTLDDQPLAEGTIRFIPSAGGGAGSEGEVRSRTVDSPSLATRDWCRAAIGLRSMHRTRNRERNRTGRGPSRRDSGWPRN